MIFKNGQNLFEETQHLIQNSERLIIIVPYIKKDSLEELLEHSRTPTEIVVRWQLKDFLTGAADLEVYEFCQKLSIPLYRNPRIHLKCYINNFTECLLTTANISRRAVSKETEINFNHEVGTKVGNLSFEDRIYFQTILNESALVTNATIEKIKSLLEKDNRDQQSPSDFDLGELHHPDKDFLLSALPMSESVEVLKRVYFEKQAGSTTEYNCAIHDGVKGHFKGGQGRAD